MFCPNIFTNRHADFSSLQIKRRDAAGRLKITLLVEDVISGQKRFVSLADRFASLEQSSGVAKRFAAPLVAIDEPNQQGRLSDPGVQLLQQREILWNETRLENQILRRISGDRQLRSQHQFRAGGCETLISADDQVAITAQISHGGVNLSETNLHVALRQIMRNLASSNSLLLGRARHSVRAVWA